MQESVKGAGELLTGPGLIEDQEVGTRKATADHPEVAVHRVTACMYVQVRGQLSGVGSLHVLSFAA